MSVDKIVIVGSFVTCDNSNDVIVSNGYVAAKDGKIIKIGSKNEFDNLSKESFWKEYNIIILTDEQFLMPGFVDCHVHGPQFPNIGLGLDKPLLEWLDKYTFPLERQYNNEEFAHNVYNKVVRRLLKNGTTTACYFGSLHLNGTMQLVKSVVKYGQRALVGKVSMNVENSMGYYNDTQKELADTEEFIKQVKALQNPLVDAVITPRFALSCDQELLTKLGELAEKYDCQIQSHISETLGEVECVLQNYPEVDSYAQVYDNSKLLTNKCIMAHAVHLTDKEMALVWARGAALAHCPASNTRLMSGLCPLRRLLEHRIRIGLGTDVAGGDSASVLDAARRAMDVSAHLQLQGGGAAALTWREAFYLATLGGATALNLDHKTGSLEVGKDLDALVVDIYACGGGVDRFTCVGGVDRHGHEAELLLQRFMYLGDDRNITSVFVRGVLVEL